MSHAFALRGLVEDNAIGDVRQLVGHAVSRDEDVIYGLFVSAEGQLWAYASPEHANVEADVPAAPQVFQTLALSASELSSHGTQRRSLHAFGQDLEEFRINVTAEDGTSLGNLLYGFGRPAVFRRQFSLHRPCVGVVGVQLVGGGEFGIRFRPATLMS